MLAFLCWQPPARPLAASITSQTPITYILTPIKRPPPPPPQRAAAAAAASTSQKARVASAAPSPAPAQPQAVTPPAERQPEAITQAAPPPDPFALPVKPEQNLKERAIAGALAADKQARKDAWTQRDRRYVNDESALAAAIGKAYRGGTLKTVEMVAADGSRITKWVMPGGQEVCYYSESNNFSGGRDPFRDTGRLSVRSCN